MAYTETRYEGWIGRMGNAIKGVVFGLILLAVSFVVLFWNEGRAVRTARTLEEGESAVVAVDSAKIDSANDGKLVHFTGRAINAAGEKLVDSTFHIAQDAIHLRREVVMYQWKEDHTTQTHSDAIGGGQAQTTTYSYSKVWKDQPIDSSNFKEAGHANPDRWRIDGNTLDAPVVTAGALTLDSSLARRINNFTPVEMSANIVDGLSGNLQSDAVYSNNAVFISNDPGRKPDPASPRIGDLKVSFKAALPGDVSVIAMQTGTTLVPYQTKNNAVELLYVGDHSAQEMFKSEERKNAMLTWILRGVGIFAMWIGLLLVLNPLKILSDVVGIIGDIVGAGIALISALVAVALSFITIAVAWLSYRPIVGIGLLGVAGCAMVGFLALRARGAARRKAGGAFAATAG